MTKLKKLTTLLLTLALVITLVPMTADAAGISKRKVSLYVGQTTTLKAGAKAKWRSGNKSIATVTKKGVVKAKKAGKTTITAKAGKKSYRCSVTVKNPRINYNRIRMDLGDTKTIRVTGASIRQCRSENPKIATVTQKGSVSGVSEGKTNISVMLSNKMTYSVPVTVYSADDNNNGVSVQNDNPTVTKKPDCNHVWEVVTAVPLNQGRHDNEWHWLKGDFKCSICGGEDKNTEHRFPHDCKTTTTDPTCTEAGWTNTTCTVCGRCIEDREIPSLGGHDFEYTIKKQVVVKDDWDLRYDYNNEHGYESMGERTATCKTCGESFEEVGFDTGVELEDGSQAVIWGVYEKDAVPYIIEWINKYREGHESDDGETLDSLAETEALNNYALFRASQFCARQMLNCKGQMGKGWVTRAGFCNAAPVGEKINLISAFMKLGGSFQSTKIRYSGGAHFRYETENGEFMDVLVAVGDDYNKPLITCEKNQHDLDYAHACHRCGWQSTWMGYEGVSPKPITENPYYYVDAYGEVDGFSVDIGANPVNDTYGYSWNTGCFDMDHDNICDGCQGPMLLKAGVASWNYCNLAIFGYGGLDFSNCYTDDYGDYYFDQPNWPHWNK